MSDDIYVFSMLLDFGFSMRTMYVSSNCLKLLAVTHRLLEYSSTSSHLLFSPL